MSPKRQSPKRSEWLKEAGAEIARLVAEKDEALREREQYRRGMLDALRDNAAAEAREAEMRSAVLDCFVELEALATNSPALVSLCERLHAGVKGPALSSALLEMVKQAIVVGRSNRDGDLRTLARIVIGGGP